MLLLPFGVHRNRPDESEQFPSNRHHDLVLVLAASRERCVALVKTLLCLLSHLLDFIAERQALLPVEKASAHIRWVLIRPRRLHQHSPEMAVASLGNPSTLHAVPAGTIAAADCQNAVALTDTVDGYAMPTVPAGNDAGPLTASTVVEETAALNEATLAAPYIGVFHVHLGLMALGTL